MFDGASRETNQVSKLLLRSFGPLRLQIPEPAAAAAVCHMQVSLVGTLQRSRTLDGHWGSNPAMTPHWISTAQNSEPCLSSCLMYLEQWGRLLLIDGESVPGTFVQFHNKCKIKW